jgi:NAD(P)-dependent dehydrogenase (short-subunit alcohol dehydrogenase family)
MHYAAALEKFPAEHTPGAGKTALVTGSSGGIGFYVARILARCGYKIIVPARPRFEEDAAGAAEAIGRETPGAAGHAHRWCWHTTGRCHICASPLAGSDKQPYAMRKRERC